MKKNYRFLLILFTTCIVQAQDIPKNVDSLKTLYEGRTYSKDIELKILQELSNEVVEPNAKLKYSNLLLERSKKMDSSQYYFTAYFQKGQALREKGDLTLALECLFKAQELIVDDPIEKESKIAGANSAIADVYSVMDDHENAIRYHNLAIQQIRKVGKDSLRLTQLLNNAGDALVLAGRYDEAMTYFYEQNLIANKIGNRILSAYSLGNIGTVYAKKGKYLLARANMDEAIEIMEEEKLYYPISIYLDYISSIYQQQNQPKLAMPFALRSLELSKKYQLKEEISKATLKLSQIYEALNQPKEALKYLNEHIIYKDSVKDIKTVQEMANIRTKNEVEKKQTELDLSEEREKAQRITIYAVLGGLLLTGLLAFGLFRRNLFIKRTSKIIRQEREKSDQLLHNILPEEAAIELKQKGKVTSKKFSKVTVLFTDFKGFTRVAESLNPEKLVESIDFYFSKFDEILEKYNLEKIKTIGDAYMVAGGLPTPISNHAELVAKAALEIRDFVTTAKMKHSVGEVRFDIRIGMHTGPVVAGVVGKNKFAYDIWGDTVNIASRMESSSEAGKINVSQSTYELLKDSFTFESRGSIEIKNRSAINMYFLEHKNT